MKTSPTDRNQSEKKQPTQSTGQPRAPTSVWASALATLQAYGALLGILGVTCLAAGGAWFVINRQIDVWSRWLMIAGLALIAAYMFLRPDEVRRAITGRRARYGSNAVILSIAAVGIVVLLNYLSTRHYKRFDLTQAKRHSLSPQSIQVLEALDSDIEVIGFYPNGQGREDFEQWIDAYRAHTDHLQYRSIDPLRAPGEADQLGWDAYGAGLLVRQGPRSFEVRRADEQDITSALLKASRDTPKTVYFLTGHNERLPTDYDARGYAEIGSALEDNGYQVKSLNLAITDTVPIDASVVVVAGPQTALLAEERERLISYLLKGGKALILIDPGPETGINEVLAPWQVSIENKVVLDTLQSLSGDPATPVIDRFEFSQMTKDLTNLLVAMPGACPIQSSLPPGSSIDDMGISFTPLAKTSARSWAESDLESDAARYDEGVDLPGPLTVVASVEAPSSLPVPEGEGPAPKTRMVLIGDSDLAANDVLSQIPNGRFLLLNAVNWLAEEEELIAIGPKAYQRPTIRLSMVQEGAVCFGTLILIPAVLVVAGILVWLKRR